MIKLSILQKDITMSNMYPAENRVSNYMKQKLKELEEEADKSIRVGKFHMCL